MKKLIVGDKVIYKGPPDAVKRGMVGRIIHTTSIGSVIGVRWDEKNNSLFHNCGGLCDDNHGYNVFKYDVEVIKE